MKKTLSTLLAILFCASVAHSQSVDAILRSIESNNIELRAILKDNEAAEATLRAENCVGGPSVEYSPFWQKNVSGLSSSELVVSQEFEFPTLYSLRSKSAGMEARALELLYNESRRDLLLEAKLGCLELIKLRSEKSMIEQRLNYADRIMELVDKLEKAGVATVLDINKSRMIKMSLEAEAKVNEARQCAIAETLVGMNASQPLNFEGIEYPVAPMIADYEEFRVKALESDAAILAAKSEVDAAGEQLNVARKSWLPSLTMGFRRNTAPGEAQNGFIVGMSFPVWGTGQRTRAARARRSAAELRAEDVKQRVETRTRSLHKELVLLDKTIAGYDTALMSETLRLLLKAVVNGQITILEYYREADAVYEKMQELIEAQYRYHTVMASLTSAEL